MKFTRGRRIALELLGPPFLGGSLPALLMVLAAVSQILQSGRADRALQDLGPGLLLVYAVAYAGAGLQSVAYAGIMEWRFSRGLDPRSVRSVGLSTLLGFCSGAAIAVAYGFGRSDVGIIWISTGGMGLLVGLALGLIIRWLSAPSGPESSPGRPSDPR